MGVKVLNLLFSDQKEEQITSFFRALHSVKNAKSALLNLNQN